MTDTRDKQPPLISVIVPASVDPGRVGECVERLLSQAHERREVIVVCGPDDSPALPEKAEGVRVVKEPEAGTARLVNRGMKEAKGQFKVVLMPHCLPEGDAWLGDMVKPFDDETVGAVVSQCIAPDKAGMDLPGLLVHAVADPCLTCDKKPVNLQIVGGLCDAYRADVLSKLDCVYEESFRSPGEAVDLSVRLATAGRRIVLSPDARVHFHSPARTRTLNGVFENALDCGHADAVLAKTWNIDWLGSRNSAAALLSLALIPLGLVHLPAAVIAAGLLFAWGWFLALRLPLLRWELPVALLNLAAYVTIVFSIRDDWAASVFDPHKWHPAIIRQWCILAAMAGSYLLVMVYVGLRCALHSLGRTRKLKALAAVAGLSIAWHLATGAGFIHGYVRGRKPGAR